MGNPVSRSAAWIYAIILKFISIFIFKIKIQEKKFLDTKTILLSKADFHESTNMMKNNPKIETIFIHDLKQVKQFTIIRQSLIRKVKKNFLGF